MAIYTEFCTLPSGSIAFLGTDMCQLRYLEAPCAWRSLSKRVNETLENLYGLLFRPRLTSSPGARLHSGEEPPWIDWISPDDGFEEISPRVLGLSSIDLRERTLRASQAPRSGRDVTPILLID